MTHAPPSRARSLILIALLALPAVAALLPASDAQGAACEAVIEAIDVSSLWLDPQGSVRFSVNIHNNASSAGGVGGIAATVDATVVGTYSDQGAWFNLSFPGNSFDANGDVVLGPKTVAVGSSAPTGAATIAVQLQSNSTPPCVIGTAEKVLTVYIGGKPDLGVQSVSLVHHDDTPTDGHQTHARQDELFTRYPDVTGTCFEQQTASSPTFYSKFHFAITLSNNGTAPLKEVVKTTGLPGSSPQTQAFGIPVALRVLDNGVQLDYLTVNYTIDGGGTDTEVFPAVWRLVNLSGPRNLTVQVDPLGQIPQVTPGPHGATLGTWIDGDGKTQPLAVQAPLLAGTLQNVTLDADKRVDGTWSVVNIGTRMAGAFAASDNNSTATLCYSATGTAFTSRVYLDLLEDDHLIDNKSMTLQEDGCKPCSYVEGKNFSIPANLKPLSAGEHTVYLVPANDTVTQLQDLAFATANVSLPDTLPPAIVSANITPLDGRVGLPVNISGVVTDDSDFRTAQGDRVSVDVTYPDGVTHNFTIPHGGSTKAGYAALDNTSALNVTFWWNSSYDQVGLYQVVLAAQDGATPPHTARFPLTGALSFHLAEFPKIAKMWSIQTCDLLIGNQNLSGAPQDCASGNTTSGEGPHKTFNKTGTDIALVTWRVEPNSTGLGHENRNTSRMSLQVTDPDGVTIGNFSVNPQCYSTANHDPEACPAGTTGVVDDCGNVTAVYCWNYFFNLTFGGGLPASDLGQVFHFGDLCMYTGSGSRNITLTKPSEYNLTLWIGDAGCSYRAWNLGNMPFYIDAGFKDLAPARTVFQLWDLNASTIEMKQPTGAISLDLGHTQLFRANVSDDIDVKAAFTAIYAANGSLIEQANMSAVDYWAPNNHSGIYQVTVPTGLGTPLCAAGTVQWQVVGEDANHTLNRTALHGFTLNDVQAPSVGNSSAVHGNDLTSPDTTFQAGENVTIKAVASDDGCFNATAVVVDADTFATVLERPMSRVAGNVYRTDNITTGVDKGDLREGNYRFYVRAVDTAQPSPHTTTSDSLPFQVLGNRAPVFTFATPSDGGFGQPGGTIRVDVGDNVQGVDVGSLVVSAGVNGAPLVPVKANTTVQQVDAAGNALSVRLGFSLPTQTGDSVVVNVSAADLSVPPLNDSLQWSFRVDGLAPRSQLSCSLSYPKPCGAEGTQSVRADTVFTVTATDADPSGKASSGVAAIRYAVDVQGQLGAVQTAQGSSATFTLAPFAQGDGIYTVRYSAIDAAGNDEAVPPGTGWHQLPFALDTTGPQVVGAPFMTPEGQSLNATWTISDPASDVAQATLFYRNGQVPFASEALTQRPGSQFWWGLLPGVQRGLQVCTYIDAVDHLGNEALNGTATNPNCFSSQNHPPSLQVTSPRDGEVVSGAFTVGWAVSDIDGDPVTVALSYHSAGDVQLIGVPLTPQEQGQRSKVINASELGSGDYVLRVDAVDNQPVNNRTTIYVNFTVGAGGGGVGVPVVDRTVVQPGETIKVTVQLDKPVSDIEARLLKDGQVVQRQAMENDPPGSHTWTASFKVTEPGTYEVEVRGDYEDGKPFDFRAATPVRVQGGAFSAPPETLGIVVVGAAVIALAALGLRHRGAL